MKQYKITYIDGVATVNSTQKENGESLINRVSERVKQGYDSLLVDNDIPFSIVNFERLNENNVAFELIEIVAG